MACALGLWLARVAEVAAETPSPELLLFDEPSVTAATKNPEPIGEVPSSVTIVTKEDIHRFGWRTLAGLLRSVRSFYGSYDRNYDYIGVRGFLRSGDYNDRILLLVNGHTYNDDIYQTAALGTEFGIDLEAIDHVEIIRGPGSALYGGNALFAVVNVVTRTGAEMGGVQARVSGGSFGSVRGQVMGGTRVGEGQVFVSGSAFHTDGPQTLRFPWGVAHNDDGDQAYQFFVSSQYRGWTLQGGANSREKHVPTGSYGTTMDDHGTKTIDARRFADLSYTTEPLPSLAVATRVYYDGYHYHGTYIYGGGRSRTENQDFATSNWVGSEVRARWRITPTNALTVGAEYAYHPDAAQKNFDDPTGVTYVDDHHAFGAWGIYAQDEWSFTPDLRLVTGLRFDNYYYGRIQELSPRGGLIWHALADTTLKLLVGRAFRPPNLLEQYYSYTGAGVRQLPNPHLDPEHITTYEAVLEQELWRGIRGEVALYHYDIENLIELVTISGSGGNVTQYRNIDSVEANGAEVELRIPLPRRMELRTHYSMQEATTDGRVLTNSPRNLGGAQLLAPLPLGIQSGVEFDWVGPRRTRTGRRLEAAPVLNLTLNAPTPVPGFSLNFSLYDLLDRTFPDPVGSEIRGDRIAQDGMTFRFEVVYAH